MFTRIALASVVFGLLVACSGTPEGDEQRPVATEEATGEVKQEMQAAGTCECTLKAGDKVWRCNGRCSDSELKNLPH